MIVSLALIAVAHASAIDDRLLAEAARAKTPGEARAAQVRARSRRIAGAACESQLSARRPPVACFAAIAAGEKLATPNGRLGSTLWLDEACSAAADWVEATEEGAAWLRAAKAAPELSAACRASILRRRDEIEYILERKDPAALARLRGER